MKALLKNLVIAGSILTPIASSGSVTLTGFGGIASTDTTPVTSLTDTTAVAETITDVSLVIIGATHDWIGDLQITLSNGTSEIIIMGLQDGLTFNGTNTQAGNVGAGSFGADTHLSGDPDTAPTLLDYTFITGGVNFDTAAESTPGGGTIDATTDYAPTAEDSAAADSGIALSFADVFGGQSSAGTWTINVVDTFSGGDDGSITGFELTLTTIPEPSSAVLAGLGAIGLLRRRR